MKLKEYPLKPEPFQIITIKQGSIIHNVLVKDPANIYLLIEENYTEEDEEIGVFIVSTNDTREIPDNYIYLNSFKLHTPSEDYTFHVFTEDTIENFGDNSDTQTFGIDDILNNLN